MKFDVEGYNRYVPAWKTRRLRDNAESTFTVESVKMKVYRVLM